MADVLPQIRVNATSQDGTSKAIAVPGSQSNDSTHAISTRAKSPEVPDGTVGTQTPCPFAQLTALPICQHANFLNTARPLSRTSKLLPNFSKSQSNATGEPNGGEGRRDSQAIDPLSHVCSKESTIQCTRIRWLTGGKAILKRTNTTGIQSPKMRSPVLSEEDFPVPEPVASVASSRTSTEPIARTESNQPVTKDKKYVRCAFSLLQLSCIYHSAFHTTYVGEYSLNSFMKQL